MEEKLIVLAEDDQDLSYILGIHLNKLGYTTVNFQLISDVKSFLRRRKPYLVIMDNHLTDGMTLDHISRIKTVAPKVSIILMTADFIHDVREHKNYCFLDGLLLKPFPPERLNDILEKAAMTGT
jgi:DNA-binding NtrC family response regulator